MQTPVLLYKRGVKWVKTIKACFLDAFLACVRSFMVRFLFLLASEIDYDLWLWLFLDIFYTLCQFHLFPDVLRKIMSEDTQVNDKVQTFQGTKRRDQV